MTRAGWWFSAAALPAAVLVLALASQLAVPAGEVPITLQSLAVVLVGALLGPARGTAAVLVWLAAAAAGAPVLAGGIGGLERFAGPSAGFLLSFAPAALLAGVLARRGWGGRFGLALLLALAAHAVCLGGGALWLAAARGAGAAWTSGLLPFLPGAAIKSLVAAAVIRAATARGWASTSAFAPRWASPRADPAPAPRSVPGPRA